ncbi:MAG: IS110 family transposase [Chloroflexi bacterium]|nr:IS110 family transposase [Chloroflexota bacterium]
MRLPSHADKDTPVGYAGLGTRVHDSGMTTRTGKITKAGRRDLRVALVEAANVVVSSNPHWKAELARLEPRLGRNRAIVAIARHLLELVWSVLMRRQPYRGFSHERIAYKYLTWSWQMDEEARDGLTRQQFARYYLMKLGIGHDLTRIALDRETSASDRQ